MNKIQYIALVVLLLALFSCKDKFVNDIDIEVPETELQLAINLELTAGDTTASTFVARTSNINEPASTFFSDALVELYKEDALIGILDFDNYENVYIANLLPEDLVEGEYTVEVSGIEGFDNIKSTQIIPEQINILDVTYQEDGTIEEDYGYAYTVDEATVKFKDPADQENYYQVFIIAGIEDENGNLIFQREFSPSSINPFAETSLYYKGVLINDQSFNGQEFNLSLGINGGQINIADPDQTPYIIVELNNISKDNYLYQRSLAAHLNAVDNPFAEPVVVHNNIENGIGIFRTSNSSNFRIDLE